MLNRGFSFFWKVLTSIILNIKTLIDYIFIGIILLFILFIFVLGITFDFFIEKHKRIDWRESRC
jgi:hypothetical protein